MQVNGFVQLRTEILDLENIMVRLILGVMSALLFTATGSASFAQQPGQEPAQTATSPDTQEERRFNGFYLGAGGGYGDFSAGGSSGYGEFFLGIRKQMPSGLVYAVELKGSAFESNSRDSQTIFIDYDGVGSIMAKLGYTSNNRLMLYGGAGYSEVDVLDNRVSPGASGGVAFEAGLEYMATPHFGFRFNGQYHAVGNDADVATVGAALVFSF